MTTAGYVQDFDRFSHNGGGRPEWLLPLRREAIGQFETTGFPTSKNEDWRFTNLAPLAQGHFPDLPAATALPTPSAVAPHLIDPEWPVVVLVNGRVAPSLSRVSGLPAGVRVESLADAWASSPDIVAAHLGKSADVTTSSFTALNTAFMVDGVFIHVPGRVAMKRPIQLLFLTDAEAPGASHPRVLVVLDPGAEATVIEHYAAVRGRVYFTNAVTEIALADGARLDHYKVQRESEAAYHVGTFEARQGRDSHLGSLSFAMGAALSRSNIYTVLAGEGAHATLNGLYIGHGSQHVDHQTRIEHAEPNCTSHELYKGILDDTAHGVFNGKVYVQPIAQKTDGKQTNQNLLLSDRARVDTKPQLEIYADDVRCTHGATVGQLDPVALFYCKSRGLPTAQARTLLTYGFAADVIEQMPSRPVARYLEDLLMARFLEPAAVPA